MLLKHADDLEQQRSINPQKQVTSEGSRAPNAPPQTHHFSEIVFHLKTLCDFAFCSVLYVYIYFNKKQMRFLNPK